MCRCDIPKQIKNDSSFIFFFSCLFWPDLLFPKLFILCVMNAMDSAVGKKSYIKEMLLTSEILHVTATNIIMVALKKEFMLILQLFHSLTTHYVSLHKHFSAKILLPLHSSKARYRYICKSMLKKRWIHHHLHLISLCVSEPTTLLPSIKYTENHPADAMAFLFYSVLLFHIFRKFI